MNKRTINTAEENAKAIDILTKLYGYIKPDCTFGLTIGLETGTKEDYKYISNYLKNTIDDRFKIISSFAELDQKDQNKKILIVINPTRWQEWDEDISFHLTAENDQVIFIFDNSPECYYLLMDESWEIDRKGKIKSVSSSIF